MTVTLKKYSTNLNNRAQKGQLDPVIGRNEEIRRLMQILSRRTKNNPVLLGDPGVGKTAIVRRSGPKNCLKRRTRHPQAENCSLPLQKDLEKYLSAVDNRSDRAAISKVH